MAWINRADVLSVLKSTHAAESIVVLLHCLQEDLSSTVTVLHFMSRNAAVSLEQQGGTQRRSK